MNKYIHAMSMVCFLLATPIVQAYKLERANMVAAQERYERTARIRYWQTRLGLVAKIAFDSATMYKLLMPLWNAGAMDNLSVAKPVSWGAWGRAHLYGMAHEAGNMALHMLVNQLASPLVQKLQDKVSVPVTTSWFLTMFTPAGHVMLSQDLALFVKELEAIDTALRTLITYQDTDNNYQQTIMHNISAMMERSLGYMLYAAARLQERDKVASLTVRQVVDSLERLTNELSEFMLADDNKIKMHRVTYVSKFRQAWHEQCALLRCMVFFQGERLSV